MHAGRLTAGVLAAGLLISGCAQNVVHYNGPTEVPGPAGTFAFTLTADGGPVHDVRVHVDPVASMASGFACLLLPDGRAAYSGGYGTCDINGRTDDQWMPPLSGGSNSNRVVVRPPTPTPTPNATAPAAAPSPAQASSSAPAQPAPAAPAAPAPTPAVSRSTSATPSASKSASASPTAATSTSTAPATAALLAQTVTWNPTTAISTTTPSSDGGREFTPSTQATTSGDGAITYSIGSPSTSACHLRAGRIVVVGQNGSCTVIATAAASAKYTAASTSVTFNISNYTDPNPAPATSAPVF